MAQLNEKPKNEFGICDKCRGCRAGEDCICGLKKCRCDDQAKSKKTAESVLEGRLDDIS